MAKKTQTDNNSTAPWKDMLISCFAEAEIHLGPAEVERFGIYLKELQQWNQAINITSITHPGDIVVKHFIDSLLVIKHVDLKSPLVDIGSGGGFPAIPLKIKAPELSMSLIEPTRKKAHFLKHIIRRLKLEQIEVFNGRAEDYTPKRYFETAISRAVGDLSMLCRLALPLVKTEGIMVAMKGVRGRAKLEDITLEGARIIARKKYALPRHKGGRSLVIVQKCFT